MARGSFGERLKRERELREVSLNEVTVATRISGRFLDALENEEWHKLPGGVFNRGFVRAVARYLGLNEENLLSEYDLARGEPAVSAPPPYESKIPRPPLWVPILSAIGILVVIAALVVGGIYGWRRYSARHAARKASPSAVFPAQTQPGSNERAAASAADPSSASANSFALDLSVSTSAATRVRVVADDVVVLDAELPAGETRHFAANRQFEVTAADSSAVLLELNGRAMPPVGAPGASGTIVLSQKDLRQAPGGNTQP